MLGVGRCTRSSISKTDRTKELKFYAREQRDGLVDLLIQPYEKQAAKRLFELATSSRTASNTGDPRVAELACGWMKNCLDNHEHCYRSLHPTWHPTRLPKIDGEQVRLIATKDSDRSTYATVSYCWGTRPFRVLTSANFAEFQTGIPLESFPKTLHDLILTAKRLALPYIWIDSYCIIQQGDLALKDKQKEIAGMSQVYANAPINIAASAARKSSTGCFVNREALGEPSQVFFGSGWRSKKGSYLVYRREYDPDSRNYFGPLYGRAWTLQEMEVAPRVLHLGNRQVGWECDKVAVASESFPCGTSRSHSLRFDPPRRLSSVERGMNSSGRSEIWRLWHSMAEAYSSMELTRPTEDKLAAIGALASKFAGIFRQDYIAGHFWPRMQCDLLWRPIRIRNGRGTLVGSRATEWRAPSWSWASMDCPIAFPSLGTHRSVRPCAEVIGTLVEPVDAKNPYGAVHSASIDIRGRTLHFTSADLGPELAVYYQYAEIAYQTHEKAVLYFDDMSDLRRAFDGLTLLPITNDKKVRIPDEPESTFSSFRGLILQGVPPDAYERLGVFNIETYHGRWNAEVVFGQRFEEREPEVIRLV